MKKILSLLVWGAAILGGQKFELKAASVPSSLNKKELQNITKYNILPAMHRSWTAHGLPAEGDLGFELGLETGFVMRKGLLGYGDGRGTAPSITPVPRFWGSVDLLDQLSLSGSLAIGSLFDGIQTAGFALQWTALPPDQSSSASMSLLMGYTYVDLYGDLTSNVTNLAVQVSKDLMVWQPYAGAGFAVGNTTANAGIVEADLERGPYTAGTYHVYVGARVDLIAKLSFQLDILASKPSLGVLLQHSF